jgi:hypothetical protein
MIDHPSDPENRYLCHSFVESPDMLNVYSGNTVTEHEGEAVVALPDYFADLTADVTYQLTVMEQFAQVIVFRENGGDNTFTIKTDRPIVKVSWQVTGIRKDPWARRIASSWNRRSRSTNAGPTFIPGHMASQRPRAPTMRLRTYSSGETRSVGQPRFD